MNDSEIISIIANNARRETREIRKHFTRGDISFDQAKESLLSLRHMLWNVAKDLNDNGVLDESNAIDLVFSEVKDVLDMIYNYKAKLEVYESKLRRELNAQFEVEHQEA